MNSNTPEKSLTFLEALSLVVGMIVGSGIFLKSGVVLAEAGSIPMSIAAWITGGVITLASALTVAEIAAAIPKTGGLYIYLEELYGEPVGFLLGWVQTMISYPASIAAQAIAFATYFTIFVPMTAAQRQILAVGVLLFLLAMNIISTQFGGRIQLAATVGKLLPIALIVAFGLVLGWGGTSSIQQPLPAGTGFGAAVLSTLWAYDGWISVTNVAGELKNPAKDLPRAIGTGVFFVIATYLLFNLAIFRVLPMADIVASSTPAADAAVQIFGRIGSTIVALGIMVSVFGSINGLLMTGSRVPYSMGSQGLFPFGRLWGWVSPRFDTPFFSLLLMGAVALFYLFSGTFDTLTNLLVFVLWIFFTMGVAAIFRLRRVHKPRPGGYRVPFYPLTPIVGLLGGVYILGSTIWNQPLQSLAGLGITLAGLPVYYLTRWKSAR